MQLTQRGSSHLESRATGCDSALVAGNDQQTLDRTIPTWLNWTCRLAVLSGLILYCFLVYTLVRPLFATFGFDSWTTTRACATVILLGAFVLFLLPLADLPLIWLRHARPAARARRGNCPHCGYPRHPGSESNACPECGSLPEMPGPWELSRQTIIRFLLLLLIAVIAGSTLGETMLLLDESSFLRDAEARSYPLPGDSYSRQRAWPNTHATMTFTLEDGARCEPMAESKRIRRWMREE